MLTDQSAYHALPVSILRQVLGGAPQDFGQEK
jgi:hypothetical protein